MLQGIKGIDLLSLKNQKLQSKKTKSQSQTRSVDSNFYSKAASNSLKLNSLNFARTISFSGALLGAFQDLSNAVITCKTTDSDGEVTGTMVNVNKLLHEFNGDFLREDDAIKTTIQVNSDQKDVTPIYARTQIKMIENSSDVEDTKDLSFQMAVRDPAKNACDKTDNLRQEVKLTVTPINYKGEGTKEQTYVLNTKGNVMAVVEDGNDVLLTNAGSISKKDKKGGVLNIDTTQWIQKNVIDTDTDDGEIKNTQLKEKNEYKKFTPAPQEVRRRKLAGSIGDGGEIIIGMENGRFVDEIKSSIANFVEKVQKGEIILDPFVADKNAKNTQLVMLAGGFGSRAEYTNASSSAIFHGTEGGTQSTKGVFKTATGFTPMETTFITLHNAGLLDCSKNVLEIGKNIKFYLNKAKNEGSGGYTLDLTKKMSNDSAKSIMVFPNDAMSRMTNAIGEANDLVQSGKAAIAMIAKKVKAVDCIGNFGIMRLGEDNQILEFKEKPKQIPENFVSEKIDNNKMCLTNTFQFAVSKETLKVMDLVEKFYTFPKDQKEKRDWSKHYIPVIQAITMYDNPDEIRDFFKNNPNVFGEKAQPLDDETIYKAKEILKDQKLYAVPTDEPWADCGSLNQLYATTMDIASGVFKLEDFERAHVLSCVNTETGLVASSPEQKERIEEKYTINGQVMVVPQAEKPNHEKIKDIEVVVNE